MFLDKHELAVIDEYRESAKLKLASEKNETINSRTFDIGRRLAVLAVNLLGIGNSSLSDKSTDQLSDSEYEKVYETAHKDNERIKLNLALINYYQEVARTSAETGSTLMSYGIDNCDISNEFTGKITECQHEIDLLKTTWITANNLPKRELPKDLTINDIVGHKGRAA